MQVLKNLKFSLVDDPKLGLGKTQAYFTKGKHMVSVGLVIEWQIE